MYDENFFQALDYILDEAAKVGVRLILTLADNWSASDSKSQARLTILSTKLAHINRCDISIVLKFPWNDQQAEIDTFH